MSANVLAWWGVIDAVLMLAWGVLVVAKAWEVRQTHRAHKQWRAMVLRQSEVTADLERRRAELPPAVAGDYWRNDATPNVRLRPLKPRPEDTL